MLSHQQETGGTLYFDVTVFSRCLHSQQLARGTCSLFAFPRSTRAGKDIPIDAQRPSEIVARKQSLIHWLEDTRRRHGGWERQYPSPAMELPCHSPISQGRSDAQMLHVYKPELFTAVGHRHIHVVMKNGMYTFNRCSELVRHAGQVKMSDITRSN